jgi:hypothetical protein
MDSEALPAHDALATTLAVKNATEFLVDRVGGYVKAAAILGRGKSTVQRWASRSPDDMDWTIPASCIAVLEHYAGAPAITAALAEAAGCSIGPGPAERRKTLVAAHRSISRAYRDYAQAFDDAEEDGDFTPNELADLAQRLARLGQETARTSAVATADAASALKVGS